MYEEKTVADLEENILLMKSVVQEHRSFTWHMQILAKDTAYTMQSLADRGMLSDDELTTFQNELESLMNAADL